MKQVLISFLVLTLAALACAVPGLPMTAPEGPSAPADAAGAVATSVAATLTAAAPTPVPDPLPAPLYYLGRDSAGRYQVFRLAPDGLTRTQLTFEPADVDSYDVHPLDGRIAYVSNNQLLLVNADGSGRAVLVAPGALSVDEDYYRRRVGVPRWSRDGSILAYGLNGLVLRDMATGGENQPLTNIVEKFDTFSVLRESYEPYEYSPDGSRLMVRIGYYEGQAFGVYVPSSGAFYKLTLDSGYGGDCCNPRWSRDGRAILMASPWLGMIEPGLWRFDAASGRGVALLPSETPTGGWNFASSPLDLPDGNLQFFFASLGGYPEGSDTPLMLVRSGPDAVSGRTVIYPEAMIVSEALWAPDGSRVVVASPAPARSDYRDNTLRLIRLDGGPTLTLASGAYLLRWGR